ncbi:uncharacterized protein QC763_0034040 [Podospora pseudopauciseta]|nr:hypothetical protein QC763_0034040 [Podospora pseudopauciseta]
MKLALPMDLRWFTSDQRYPLFWFDPYAAASFNSVTATFRSNMRVHKLRNADANTRWSDSRPVSSFVAGLDL